MKFEPQPNIQHGTRNIQYPGKLSIDNSQFNSLLDIPYSVLDIQLSIPPSYFILSIERISQWLHTHTPDDTD